MLFKYIKYNSLFIFIFILMSETKKEYCLSCLENLFEKYKDNEYMLQRINNHISFILPNTLENECKNYEKRQNLNTYLSEEQQIFMQVFLSKNNYYYLSNSGFYYEYNGKDYLIVKEDDIIHKLLSTISKERILLQWKHRTKINIIKQIKERSLFTSIPETDTIQNVLNVIYPSFFISKNSAKYFLTIIGDNILKKNTQLIFLVSQKMKQFLNELDNLSIVSISINNTTNNFMTKYHENHSYENCRLIKINENFNNDVWRDIFKKIGLNLLCVAAHYSKRYENSDKFIENKADDELKSYAYYIKNTNETIIVDEFCEKYIHQDISTTEFKIEWKNIHFIWKQFLSTNNLPNVIYSNTLKTLLKTKFLYDENSDSFCGIISKYLPVYKDFIQFWDETIIHSPSLNFDNEIEIDEISYLFKQWSKTKNILSEENIIKILKHFFLTEIIEDKYVLNITSTLWNKTYDIEQSIPFIKQQIMNVHKLSLICFDDLYNYYKIYCNNHSFRFIVSKRFFEKYLYFKFSEYIVYDKFIKIEWIHNFE